jgi:ADP-ribosylglycohydrolase
VESDLAKTREPTPIERSRLSLAGLSIGDAFGELFFGPSDRAIEMIGHRLVPCGPWRYTDDTVMALSIIDVLAGQGRIDQDRLASLFASRYRIDPIRGYGRGAHEILQEIGRGASWRQVSCAVFAGQGSKGNGGAMRAAPIGAYFADDPDRVAAEAALSGQVTHAHLEGQAGAVAVALAAAWAWNHRRASDLPVPEELERPTSDPSLFEFVGSRLPPGPTRDGIDQAKDLAPATTVHEAARVLGSGERVLAEDTVPFCLWVASRHLDSYREALWEAVAGFGDIDTNGAIVGGIVILSAPPSTVPARWKESREPLPPGFEPPR